MRLSIPATDLLQERGLRRGAFTLPRSVRLRIRTVQALSAALAGTVLTTPLASGLLVYRLAVQFTASVPARGPAAWLYQAAGLVVLPFRPLDTTRPIASSRALEFPALVALEAVLAGGCLLGFVAFGALRLARRLGSPVAEVWLDLDALAGDAARLARGAQATADRSLAALASAWLYAVAYLDTRDWEGMRRRLHDEGLRAYASLKRAAAVALSESRLATAAACECADELAAGLAVACLRGAGVAGVRARLLVATARGKAPAAVRLFERLRAAAGAAARARTAERFPDGRGAQGMSRREFFHRIGTGGAQ